MRKAITLTTAGLASLVSNANAQDFSKSDNIVENAPVTDDAAAATNNLFYLSLNEDTDQVTTNFEANNSSNNPINLSFEAVGLGGYNAGSTLVFSESGDLYNLSIPGGNETDLGINYDLTSIASGPLSVGSNFTDFSLVQNDSQRYVMTDDNNNVLIGDTLGNILYGVNIEQTGKTLTAFETILSNETESAVSLAGRGYFIDNHTNELSSIDFGLTQEESDELIAQAVPEPSAYAAIAGALALAGTLYRRRR